MCYRGWSNRIDDLEPVTRFLIVGVEAKRLAKEGGGGVMLVAACRELAEQAKCQAAVRVEPDDVAEIALGVEVAAKGDVRAGADQKKRHALGLVLECIGDHGDDAGVVPSFVELGRRRDDSSIHDCQNQQALGQRVVGLKRL